MGKAGWKDTPIQSIAEAVKLLNFMSDASVSVFARRPDFVLATYLKAAISRTPSPVGTPLVSESLHDI